MQNGKLSREEIIAMTMRQFNDSLPEPRRRVKELQLHKLVALCAVAGYECPYIKSGKLPRNEKEWASIVLLSKVTVGEVLDCWMTKGQYAECLNAGDRYELVRSLREFLHTICSFGFPRDVDNDNSEYNAILDSFDNARNLARSAG